METKNSFLKNVIYDYKNSYQMVELVALSAISFFLPIVLAHPQLMVGAVINMLLFRAALSMEFKKSLPIILLPSMGVVTAGLLFGNLTSFLLYFVPFIWMGNAIYVLSAKYINHHYKKNYGTNVIIASLLKSGLLFGTALMMVNIFSFPPMFLTAMGLIQLYTALIGGFGALAITKAEVTLKNK